MPSSRGFTRGRSQPKRMVTWDSGPQMVDGARASTGSDFWTTGVQLVGEARVTIVRIRGVLRIHLLTATAAGDGFFGALGIGLINSEAFTAGITSSPTPFADPNWPGWLYHSYFDVRSVTATIADGVNAASASLLHVIDSKAMRKMGENEILMGVVEVVESGTATIEFQGDTRVLFKLS